GQAGHLSFPACLRVTRLRQVGPRALRDHGMVTAEVALVLPVLLIVLALCLWGIAAGIDQLRCVDAAREAARAAARGDSTSAVHEVAVHSAPPGAVISVSLVSGLAVVEVHAVVHPFGSWLTRLGGLRVTAR